MKLRTLMVSFAMLSGLIFSAPFAFADDFDKKAETFVQTMADKALHSFRTLEGAALQQEFRTLLNENFDVRAIGKWVLGRNWRRAEDAEKEEYLKLFEDFIVTTYSNRFSEYAGEDITITVTQSITKNENDALVRSEIKRPNSEPLSVDWRVKANSDNELKVVDVMIAGVSMSQAQRSEFASVIKRNGDKVSGLIDALKSKTSTLVENVAEKTE